MDLRRKENHMNRKRKILAGCLLVCFFAGTFMAMWEAAGTEVPESERCDGGHTCAMKYSDDLLEMKKEKNW